MHSEVLSHFVLILLIATFVLSLFEKMHLPSVLGYLIAGLLIGPEAFNILTAQKEFELLSEIGIILMMFMAGLEFSWPRLKKNILTTSSIGFFSVASIVGITMVACIFSFGLTWQTSFLIGGAIAMSSTALVSKQLMDQQEFYTGHGRTSFDIVLFQDLATLFFLIAIPSIANPGEESITLHLTSSLLTMFAVFTGLYLIGQKLERPAMKFAGALKSDEIFVLMTLLIILIAAWVSDTFNLPVTIGAFLAGMVIGETEFKYKIEEDIRPFRDILLGIFFIGIGMTIKISVITSDFINVFAFFAAIILIKFIIITLVTFIFKRNLHDNFRTGLILAHCGEFSLLLIVLGMQQSLITETLAQTLLAAFILSIALSTLFILYNQRLSFFLLSFLNIKETPSNDLETIESHQNLSGHIILCGFGETGKSICTALLPTNTPIAVIETDPRKVESAIRFGCHAIFGDASNLKILKAIGIEKARALVVTFDRYDQTVKILHKVRKDFPELPVIVRIHHTSHVENLFLSGATTVLPDGAETGVLMGQKIIHTLGINTDKT